jgi:DNA invertase Pin-like site-specific DNA recombinase
MFQVTGAFAEFERSMIRQRIHAGLKRAKDAGKTFGRPRIDAKRPLLANHGFCAFRRRQPAAAPHKRPLAGRRLYV